MTAVRLSQNWYKILFVRQVVTSLLALIHLVFTLGLAQDVESLRQKLEDGLYSSVVLLGSELLNQEPENAEAHLLYAYGLYYTSDFVNARLEFDKAQILKINPSPEVKHLSGLLKASEGDVQGAFEDLQTAFEETQDYQIAMDWGQVAWANNLPEKALEAFAKASQTPFGQTQIWPELNRGRIFHLSLQNSEAAIEAYEKALQIFDENDFGSESSPGYFEILFRLGQVYEAQGDIEQAKLYYESINNLDPNYEPALATLEHLSQ